MNATPKPTPDNQLIIETNLLDILASIYRWRKQLGYLVGGVGIGAVIITLCLSNYYTAYTTFIPANEEKQLFNTENAENNSLYGDEDAIDRALIFANSPVLINYMIQTFDLANRYAINASTPKGQDKVANRFLDLYKVKKNQYSGIEVSIADTDPQMAARMIDSLVWKLGDLYRNATFGNKQLIIQTYEQAIKNKQLTIQSISDSLSRLRKEFKIYDVKQQSEMLSKIALEAESQLIEAQSKLEVFRLSGKKDSITNYEAAVRAHTEKIRILQNKEDSSLNSSINIERFNRGRDVISYYEILAEGISDEMAEMQTKCDQFKAQANSKAEAIIILEPVQIPKVKSYPGRSLMVIGAVFLAFVLGVIAILMLEASKRVDWTKITQSADESEPKTSSPSEAKPE